MKVIVYFFLLRVSGITCISRVHTSAYDYAKVSIDTSTAFLASTEALYRLYFRHEVVVEGQLLSLFNLTSGNEYDMGLAVDCEVLTDQIRLARVVDVASLAAIVCRINDELLVKAEEVAVTNA